MKSAVFCAFVFVAGCGGPTHTQSVTSTTTTPTPTTTTTSTTPPPKSEEAMRVVDASFVVVARSKAYDAVAEGARIFALDPDRKALRGHDLATGKELWKTAHGAPTDYELRVLPSFGPAKRVLVHADNQLVILDPSTGAIVAKNTGPYRNSKTWIGNHHGACTVSDDCDLQFIDCEDAHPFGPRLTVPVMHLYKSLGEPHDNVCKGARLVLGRAGNVVVAVTDGLTWQAPDFVKEDVPVTVAIDVKTGKPTWTSRAHGCTWCIPEASSVSSDGVACWIADHRGRLDVFECATGKPFFTKQFSEGALGSSKPELFTTWIASGGLFVSSGTEATLLEPKSGKTIWTTKLPKDGLGLPLATPLDLPLFSTWGAHTILLLDPKSGKEAARFDQPGYTELVQASDLGVRLVKGPSFDPKGNKRAFVDEKPFVLERSTKPVTLKTEGAAKTLVEATTDLAIVAQRRTDTADEVALLVWGTKNEPLELVFARRSH